MRRDPRVYVLLLNWRGWRDTVECLESVFRLDYPDYRVIVCDNDSGDGSMERIAAWARGEVGAGAPEGHPLAAHSSPPAPKPIRYVELTREEAERGAPGRPDDAPLILVQTGGNLGYAGGNNVGLRYVIARGDASYVWLLNNDTVADPGALLSMVRTAEEDDRVGMVGSRLLHYDQPDRIQAIAGGEVVPWQGLTRYLGAEETDSGQWSEPLQVGYVTGASMLVRTALLETVGELDERYFLYSEEVDWCLRARERGWRLVYSPGSVVWHKGGQSVGHGSRVHDYYGTRSMLLLVRRFYPALLPVTFAYSLFRCLAPKLVRLQGGRLSAVLRAYRDFLWGCTERDRPPSLGRERGGGTALEARGPAA